MRSSDLYRASASEYPAPVDANGLSGDGANGSARWVGASTPRAEPHPDGVYPACRGDDRDRVRGWPGVRRHGGYPFFRDDPLPPIGGCVFVRGSGVFPLLVLARVSVGGRCRGGNPFGAWGWGGSPMVGLRDCQCYPSMGPCRISIGTPPGNLFNTLSAPCPHATFTFPPVTSGCAFSPSSLPCSVWKWLWAWGGSV